MTKLVKEGEGRWMVRKDGIRLGLILGGNRIYCAESVNGKFVGRRTTLRGAASILERRRHD